MDSATKVMKDLDTGAATWRNLTKPQRRAALAAALTRLAEEHDVMDGRLSDQVKPNWAPKTCSMYSSVGISLGALVDAAGMRNGKASTITCDCGQPWTHIQEITIINGNGNEITERMPLCDACYAEFLAMERIYG